MAWVLRVLAFGAGLVFAASLVVALLFVALIWALRALWAMLTGRPVTPWVMRIDPRQGWQRMRPAAAPREAQPRGSERAAQRALGADQRDVSDVEVRDAGDAGDAGDPPGRER
jgi:hypothetical protein